MPNGSIFEELLVACSRGSSAAAIRIVAQYEPSAGPDGKVFPPTYPVEGKYLVEKRYIGGVEHDAVALDAVQSQANRVEEVLLDATEAGDIELPYIEVRASLAAGAFRVTSLDAPHRSPDAYFRDSQTPEGVDFDKSPVGQALRAATGRTARAYFQHSPTDLVLGIWDSQRGGRGLRLPRAYSSEIVAVDPSPGRRAAGRLDPYNMQGGEVFYDKHDPADWSFDAKGVETSRPTKGKPSNVLHGNALAKDAPGGFAVRGITRTAVISLAVLQRLRFPAEDASAAPGVDAAGRSVLASLALLGDRLAFSGPGLFLRSGCDLVRTSERLEWVSGGAAPRPFAMNTDEALALFNQAVAHAAALGLAFAQPIRLDPKPNLLRLIELNLSRPMLADEE